MFLIADLYACEDLAEGGEELIFELIVEFDSTFGEGVKEGVEDRLGQGVEILLKEYVVFLFVRNRKEKAYVILCYPLLELRF